MTQTTKTLEPRPAQRDHNVGPTSFTARLRDHWLALVVAAAVLALSVWTVTTLRDTTATAERPVVSIRQVERAELAQQGVTSYQDLPAVRRNQQRAADATVSQRELWQMELNEMRRFGNRLPGPVSPDVRAEIERLEGLVDSSPAE